MDYLPSGAIPLKIEMLAYIPREVKSEFPYTIISKEENNSYLGGAAKKAAESIARYYNSIEKR